MGRFNRFLHLERERPSPSSSPTEPERPDADDAARAARFGALQTDAASPVERTEEDARALPRFESAPRSGDLTLQRERGEDQPFIRCAQCEGDSTRFARECQHCHADLDTPAQRAFNEQLWSTLRAQRDEEAQRQADALAQKQQAAEQEARERRTVYEQMARDIRRQTEEDLGSRMGDTNHPFHMAPTRRNFLLVAIAIAAVLLFAVANGDSPAFQRLAPKMAVALGFLALLYFARGRG